MPTTPSSLVGQRLVVRAERVAHAAIDAPGGVPPANVLDELIGNARIVLIDGEKLATLMIDHGLGVTLEASYDVKRIDSDSFSEE